MYSTHIFLGNASIDANGSFVATVPMPPSIATGDHHFQVEGLSPTDNVRSATLPLVVVTAKPAVLAKLKVYFDMASAVVKPQFVSQIKALVNKSKTWNTKYHVLTWEVLGYVQPTKPNPDPQGLSDRRAKAVAAVLRSFGVKSSLSNLGKGSLPKNISSSRMAEITVYLKFVG
jgi:outer membrane protein OmpA-like peptidoglycan-associated protein